MTRHQEEVHSVEDRLGVDRRGHAAREVASTSIQLAQCRAEPPDVLRIAVVHDVEVLRQRGGPMQHTRDAADDDEANVMAGKRPQQLLDIERRRDPRHGSQLTRRADRSSRRVATP